MIPKNNPTANRLDRSVGRSISTVKPAYTDMRDLEIICPRCCTFDKDGYFVNKVIMRHDPRNERYFCLNCPNVVGEEQVRYAMRMELPEYHNYEKTPTKDNIDKVNKERQHNEKFIIKAINSESPSDNLKKSAAKVVTKSNNTNPSI